MNRRNFVRTMCLGGIATFGFPVVNFAQTRRGGRFVFVLLRGGFDGLAAVVPYGNPEYRSLRGAFAFDEPSWWRSRDVRVGSRPLAVA